MNSPIEDRSSYSKLPRMFPFSRNRRKVKPKSAILLPGPRDPRPNKGEQEHPIAL